MSMSYTNLYIHYRTIFSLAQHHKYSIADIEGMVPYERDIYVEMLVEFLEEMKKEQEKSR